MKKYVRKIFHRLTAFMLSLLAAVAILVPAVSRVAKAETLDFDNTDVLEDLSDFDLSSFPEITGGEIKLLRFMEYGFSSTSSENYGLYVYIYNPGKYEISTREGANTINIATRYKDGEPSEYANVDLKLCDYSTGIYDSRLFYKFRVSGEEIERIYENAKARDLSLAKRRYDVGGLQFWKKGAEKATLKGNTASGELGEVHDYSISRTFYFTGYAKGCGYGAENASTLACSYEELATVDLKLQHTNWRNDTPYKDYTYEEVNSVYFSIPNEILTTYGDLQKIKAEWYEYKTQPIFVTSDENAYTELCRDWIGEDVGEYTEANPWRVWWEELSTNSGATTTLSFGSLYNQTRKTETEPGYFLLFAESAKSVESMNWLFYRDDPDTLADYEVSRAEVEEWAKEYTNGHLSQGAVEARKSYYAKGLFANSIDEDRLSLLEDPSKKSGYTVQEIFADEEVDLIEYKDPNFWELLTGKRPTGTAVTYNPIQEITKTDIIGAASSISKELLVNKNDVDNADGTNNSVSFREYCKKALDNNATPYLFRFANTDYYASAARFDSRDNSEMSSVDGYVCQQTCFLDFDIISLTFEKNGTETVLAAVADPIDIFNGTTPPTDLVISSGCGCADFKSTFRIVFIVLVILVVWKIYRKIRDAITLSKARRDQKKNRRWRK